MALTPQQEKFALLVVQLDNRAAAYRQAYNVGDKTTFSTVHTEAHRISQDTEVAARIQQLRDEAANRVALPSLAQRIKEMREIETTRVSELIGVWWVNCRHCHGAEHRYQWRDDEEYAAACDQALQLKQKTLPDCSGGFGFHGLKDPAPDCPRCWGVGEQRPWVADTRYLSPAAARLYRGVKIKADGSMELLMRDQDKATDMLNRIQGAYKDGAAAGVAPTASNAAQTVAADKTPEERQRSYLRLISG